MTEGILLLGFDARPSRPTEWDESRKRRFLFRLDVVDPLSVDTMVWPSIFDDDGLERPAWVGRFAPLWESLEGLREAVRKAATAAGETCIAAFGRTVGHGSEAERVALETHMRGVHPDGTPGKLQKRVADPAVVQPCWRWLGYDVADLWGLSGLMNCGFSPDEEVEALRARWSPKLNGFHLFDRLEDAHEFKDFSNQRVAEHAPFYIDGIWLVEGDLLSD